MGMPLGFLKLLLCVMKEKLWVSKSKKNNLINCDWWLEFELN